MKECSRRFQDVFMLTCERIDSSISISRQNTCQNKSELAERQQTLFRSTPNRGKQGRFLEELIVYHNANDRPPIPHAKTIAKVKKRLMLLGSSHCRPFLLRSLSKKRRRRRRRQIIQRNAHIDKS